MAVEYFLQIDGIEGESADKAHPKAVELLSFSWGVTQAEGGSSAGGGGAGAGKATFQDFVFVARVSKASPKLFLACANGQHIKSALLTCRRSGGAPFEFLKIKLSDVVVSSYQVGGSSPDPPLDQVSLEFGRLKAEYTPAWKSGKAEPAVKAGWDLKANKKI
jgi:type VI secretion system secreted protein Hcp